MEVAFVCSPWEAGMWRVGWGCVAGAPAQRRGETKRDQRLGERAAALPWLIVPSCAGRNIWFPPADPSPAS